MRSRAGPRWRTSGRRASWLRGGIGIVLVVLLVLWGVLLLVGLREFVCLLLLSRLLLPSVLFLLSLLLLSRRVSGYLIEWLALSHVVVLERVPVGHTCCVGSWYAAQPNRDRKSLGEIESSEVTRWTQRGFGRLGAIAKSPHCAYSVYYERMNAGLWCDKITEDGRLCDGREGDPSHTAPVARSSAMRFLCA